MQDQSQYIQAKTTASQYWTLYQVYLDKTNPFAFYRWLGTGLLLLAFVVRIVTLKGYYLVTYALGIYLLNIFLAFLSPKFDPAFEDDAMDNDSAISKDGPLLPTKGDEEFRVFVRRLPEFKFWHTATVSITLSLFSTLFSVFDIPVFWPILLVYFILLFALTMKRQIKHMLKYKYVPFTTGKKAYGK